LLEAFGLPGVKAARLVVFSRGIAKYALSGEGDANLRAMPRRMEEDARLPLRVTYQTERLIHADFNFGQAHGYTREFVFLAAAWFRLYA